ncbi:hypothetical protein LJK88_49295 [Paenibacillus sp. P26]|nr:hypothetical protein LJK88_49295 [Paenibacillus sp. P26]
MEMDQLELLSSLKWHLEAKNLCLQNALSVDLRDPLSVETQKELRFYYSHYFYEIGSAIEILWEKDNFKKKLKEAMCFEDFPNGEDNYSYIRELRNSLIHRRLDLSECGESDGNITLFIAPLVTDRGGTKSYRPFDTYLLGIISKCEDVVPKVMLEYLEEQNLLKTELTEKEMVDNFKKEITESVFMPDWAKNMALNNIPTSELFENSQKHLIDELVHELKFKPVTVYMETGLK